MGQSIPSDTTPSFNLCVLFYDIHTLLMAFYNKVIGKIAVTPMLKRMGVNLFGLLPLLRDNQTSNVIGHIKITLIEPSSRIHFSTDNPD